MNPTHTLKEIPKETLCYFNLNIGNSENLGSELHFEQSTGTQPQDFKGEKCKLIKQQNQN